MAWLTLLWVLLWGHVSYANVLGGIAVSAGVVLFARLESGSLRPTRFRPWWAFRYVATLGWQLLVSNIRLAYEILTPGDGTYTGIIAVPIRGGSDAVVNLVANSITLTPGTMTIDVERHHIRAVARPSDRPDGDPVPPGRGDLEAGVTLYVHAMYAQDVEAVRHDILKLEALALHAFGTDEDHERALRDVQAHEPLLAVNVERDDTPDPEPPRC
ncbi:Na+/H+ antiporter subunit E [Ilumatobacter sp.]